MRVDQQQERHRERQQGADPVEEPAADGRPGRHLVRPQGEGRPGVGQGVKAPQRAGGGQQPSDPVATAISTVAPEVGRPRRRPEVLPNALHGASTPLGMALEPFWPLSMLGMFAIGVRIAVHGRWRGASRFWPVVAEYWAVVTVPTYAIAPQIAQYVGGVHLVVGYATLGLLLAVRPGLAGARRSADRGA
jgi:hypothetical protein